jgi:hypothetical protein
MMRQLMPTTPLDGAHPESGSKEAVAVAAFMVCSLLSFVLPVRICRVFEVPKGPATLNRWNFSEIVFRRR